MNNLRRIPSVSKLLTEPTIKELIGIYGSEHVTAQIRFVLDKVRVNSTKNIAIPEISALIESVQNQLRNQVEPSLKSVINATGIIIHTNLGRAPLGLKVYEELKPVFENYCNLEFNLNDGARGHRMGHVRDMICQLTGAEDALVVNNNASAVYMMLNVLAKNKEVLVSRGELVEIGGSFRIPDIMNASGAKMVEVGTTNRTHLKDYADNINENTALIFRAHPSNYKIIGFTKDVDNRQLAELAHKQDKIFINDIGSGYLKELPINALVSEPSVVKSLDEGADLVSFSCDKLLGGCQGGIIIGKKELIEKLSSNPLMRVFRVGKTTISILNSVLTGFLRESERKERIPVYRYLERSLDEQRTIAEELKSLLDKVGIGSSIEPCYGYVGGGSVPEEKLDSWQVLLDPKQFPRQEAAGIQKALMHGSIPVVGMMDNGRFGFKVLTLEMHHLNNIVESLMQIISKAGNL